jgi:cytochrome c556
VEARAVLDTAALPEDWRRFTKQLQQHADELSMAPDLISAAVAVAAIGGTCGDCHYIRQAKLSPSAWPQPEADLPTQGAEDIDVRMKRHAVASDELWAGLFGPSDAFWKRGADTLEGAPMRLVEQEGEPMRNELGFDVERVRDLARRARLASAPERPAIYGEFLAQCGTCHQQVAR